MGVKGSHAGIEEEEVLNGFVGGKVARLLWGKENLTNYYCCCCLAFERTNRPFVSPPTGRLLDLNARISYYECQKFFFIECYAETLLIFERNAKSSGLRRWIE